MKDFIRNYDKGFLSCSPVVNNFYAIQF